MILKISVKSNFDLPKDIEGLTERFANQIPIESNRIIDESTPRGRLYRRGRIRGRYLKGLQRVPGTKTRAFVGSRIHRASAKGQPPAVDTGRLKREIKVRRSGRGKFQVVFGAPYAGILEFQLDRPLALPAIEAAAKVVFGDV